MSPATEWRVLHTFPEPALELNWRRCLESAHFPSSYVTPEFFREPYWLDKNAFAVLALNGSDVVGVLTGHREGSEIASGLHVRPQVCWRASADAEPIAAALAEGVIAEARDASLITVHSWTPMAAFTARGFRARHSGGAEGNIVLDLTQGADRLFARFSQTCRNEIRKAIRVGVEVSHLSSIRELEDYYRIYVEWCGRKHIDPGSFELMKTVFNQTAVRRLFLAKLNGTIVAGSAFRFCPGGIVEYAANASCAEGQKHRVNNLLVWRAIEWGCAEGFSSFSMGGAHPFLQKFGGENLTTYRYRLDGTWLRRHEMRESLLRLRSKAFRLLPRTMKDALRRLARRD